MENELMSEAERVVATAQARLPLPLRKAAQAVPVVFHDWASEEILGAEFEPDILGLFVGAPQGLLQEGEVLAAPHILLFVESLWDYAEHDWPTFRREVKITYLHELGHSLGWDESEVAARGLE